MNPCTPQFDERQQQLLTWLEPWLLEATPQLQPVAGDASFRRYFRLGHQANRTGSNLILMDAPPDKESSSSFFHLAQAWRQAGICVPFLHATCEDQGFALLEDFGDCQFMHQVQGLSPEEVDPWYRRALQQLADLQVQAKPSSAQLPPYNQALLLREIQLFDDWLLDQLLELPARPQGWQSFQQQLIEQALEQPQTPVHRDYHSRNLMVTTETSLGILDFQDAVLGPCTYDAVSLIRDCYLQWPSTWEDAWIEFFRTQACPEIPTNQFRRWFDWMGMQRHLKAAGIFARLWLRDGKPGYLNDLPRTLNHLTLALQKYPETADIGLWINQQLVPHLHQRLEALKQKQALA